VGRGLYAFMLAVALAALWITLSGRIHDGLTLSLGGVSVLIVVFMVDRMRLIDDETSAFHRLPGLLTYWVWLGLEILKANLIVARAVLQPDLNVTPRLFRIRADQSTDFGRTLFANSITLTPGTVTVDIDGGNFIVHALLDSMSDPAGFEEMNQRCVVAAEGRKT